MNATNPKTITLRLFALALIMCLAMAGCDNKTKPAEPAPKPAVKVLTEAEQAQKAQAENEKAAMAVIAALSKKHPNVPFDAQQVNQFKFGKTQLFEVVSNGKVFYTNENADFILFGTLHIGEGDKVVNVTARLKEQGVDSVELTADNGVSGGDIFASLPFGASVKTVYGKGERQMAVFEDPDCRFCQQFRADLQLNADKVNATVYSFPFILQNAHPNALNRAKAIYCAKDPSKAWVDWMTAALTATDIEALWKKWSVKNAGTTDCKAAEFVDAWQDAGKELGFTATPTILFENGMTTEGRPEMDQMLKALSITSDMVKKAAAASAPAPVQAPTPAQNPAVGPTAGQKP